MNRLDTSLTPPDVTIKLEQVEHIKEEDISQPGSPDDTTIKLENLGTAVFYEGIPIKQETEEEVYVEDTSQLFTLNTSLKLENLDTSIFHQNIGIKLENEEDFKVEDTFEPVYDFLEHLQEHHSKPTAAEAEVGTDTAVGARNAAAQEKGGTYLENSCDTRTEMLSSEKATSSSSNIDSLLEIPVSKGSGNKSYKCDVCSYVTAYKHVLLIHSRIHTGLLPFSCTQCDYKCNSKQQLKFHTSKHTGVKPYKCDVCSFATAYTYSLTTHSRIHTGLLPFSCTLCDYKCNSKQQLKLHTSKHTGEKPYKCDVCSYAAVYKYALTRHSRVHTGSLALPCLE